MPGNAPKNINQKYCTPIAHLPRITVLESWMRKCPPKGGLVLCILCVVTWTTLDPSSAPSMDIELWHVKNEALTTETIHKSHSRQNRAPPQRAAGLPHFLATISNSQILGVTIPSQQKKYNIDIRIHGDCFTLPLHRSWELQEPRGESDDLGLHGSGPEVQDGQRSRFYPAPFA